MPLDLKFLNQTANDRRKERFERHERSVGVRLGGVGTVGSGNKGMKGDVWAGDRDAGQRLMVECKNTEKDVVVLKWDWLRKLVKEAREARREPVLAVRYHVQGVDVDLGLVPFDRYATLVDGTDAVLPSWPDASTGGMQLTLNHRWFTVNVDRVVPAMVAFVSRPAGFPTSWVILPLDRLKELYEAEAARVKAASRVPSYRYSTCQPLLLTDTPQDVIL